MQRRALISSLFALLGAFAQWAPAQGTMDMKGKTALVTGSTSGLGEVVARRLGAMGAIVLVHGLNESRGKEVAAASAMRGPERESGTPPHWNIYVTVASADAAASRAQRLGGKVIAASDDAIVRRRARPRRAGVVTTIETALGASRRCHVDAARIAGADVVHRR